MSRPGKSNQPRGPTSPPQVARSWVLAWGEKDEASSPYPTLCTTSVELLCYWLGSWASQTQAPPWPGPGNDLIHLHQERPCHGPTAQGLQ